MSIVEMGRLKKIKDMKELLEFGILNIDKPAGPTSFNVSDFIKRKLKLRKTSHFGTLDPKVTGVLPIALNRACKLTKFFLGEDKEYIGVMRIHKEVSMKEIERAIQEKFIGKIIQLPPVKSRVKREEREREIKRFELLEKDGKNILFHVECEGGTYIRKLISDLGDYLGIGAHMLELRRIRAGIFSEKDKEFVNLYDFERAVDLYNKGDERLLRKILIPAEQAIKKIMPVVEVKEKEIKRLLTGKPLFKKDVKKIPKGNEKGLFAVFCNGRFIEIARKVDEGEIIARPEFVLQPVNQKDYK